MAGVAPVGVKRARASPRAAAAPASLSSSFTGAGFGKQIDGQRLSVSALAPAPGSRRGGSRCVTTMAAKIAGYIKLAIEAGKANPAPPIGPALGAKVRARGSVRSRRNLSRTPPSRASRGFLSSVAARGDASDDARERPFATLKPRGVRVGVSRRRDAANARVQSRERPRARRIRASPRAKP